MFLFNFFHAQTLNQIIATDSRQNKYGFICMNKPADHFSTELPIFVNNNFLLRINHYNREQKTCVHADSVIYFHAWTYHYNRTWEFSRTFTQSFQSKFWTPFKLWNYVRPFAPHFLKILTVNLIKVRVVYLFSNCLSSTEFYANLSPVQSSQMFSIVWFL